MTINLGGASWEEQQPLSSPPRWSSLVHRNFSYWFMPGLFTAAAAKSGPKKPQSAVAAAAAS